MEHTKGPWKLAGRGDGNQQLPILADGKIIAAIRDDGSIADGKLIAAAPDLLAACMVAEALIICGGVRADDADNTVVLPVLRAAIAKATEGV